jgi:hypothetical protein
MVIVINIADSQYVRLLIQEGNILINEKSLIRVWEANHINIIYIHVKSTHSWISKNNIS